MANSKNEKREHPIHDAFVKKETSLTDSIAKFAGDIRFVYVHALIFIIWVLGNVFAEGSFDPYPFTFLTFIVSLEAIFLSTFVLINQNKDAAHADRRARLDLEVDKRSEKQIEEMIQSIDEIKVILKK